MKYEPKLPEHNDNVSHEQPLREFFLILGGLTALVAVLFWALGWLVDVGVDHLSEETEARINRAVAMKWEREKSFSPEKQAMLQELADELRQCADLRYPVQIHLTGSSLPNAAVFPGGQIVVFAGLLDKVHSKNGLSFVLAHEISHLRNRDHLRAMGRSLLLAAISAALTGANSDITQIFIPIDRMSMASHSQGREMAADNRALQILNCRYGHAGGATEFFEAMKHDERATKDGFSHYFSSHPELQQRIDNINRLIEQKGLTRGPVSPFELAIRPDAAT
jgi:beta-barrel assembly-enhancing protease